MKLKTKNDQMFVMCAGCGKTFVANPLAQDSLQEHQASNKECEGFFTIEVFDK